MEKLLTSFEKENAAGIFVNSEKKWHYTFPGGGIWSAHNHGMHACIIVNYSKYTSAFFVISALRLLCKVSIENSVIVVSSDNRGVVKKKWSCDEFENLADHYDSNADWGEWYFLPSCIADDPRSLEEILKIVPTPEFLISIDLDGGMLILFNEQIKKSLGI